MWLKTVAGQRLTAGGDSLGGAVATLLAQPANASALIDRVAACRQLSFARLVLHSNRTQERSINCCNVAPRVPPPEHGSEHVGTNRIEIASNGVVLPNADDAAIRHDRDRAQIAYLKSFVIRRGAVLVRDLADDAPIDYLSAFFCPCRSRL